MNFDYFSISMFFERSWLGLFFLPRQFANNFAWAGDNSVPFFLPGLAK